MEKSLQYIKTMLELDENQAAYLEICRLLAKGNISHESSWLNKPDVINRRELLLAFCDHLNEYPGLEEVRFDFMMQDFIDKSQ